MIMSMGQDNIDWQQ